MKLAVEKKNKYHEGESKEIETSDSYRKKIMEYQVARDFSIQ